MKKVTWQRIGAAALAVLVWQTASMAVGSALLLPSPAAVLVRLAALLPDGGFWRAVWFSFCRIAGGFGAALVLGTALAFAAGRWPAVDVLLRPYVLVIKSVPVASFIILALIWMRTSALPLFISFLMVFPILYTNVLAGIRSADRELLEMARVFRVPWLRQARCILLPAAEPFLLAGSAAALGMSWKAGVAAEVIGVVGGSIGEKLENVSLTVPAGAVLCLMAPSGWGKTTLLRCIAGLEKPDSGTVRDVPERIGYVFPEDRLCGHMSAVENVRLATGRRVDSATIEAHLTELGLGGCLAQPAAELSGGQRRRVAIARAVCFGGGLLLLDEPFKGLDAETRQQAAAYILRHRNGAAVVCVTHDREDAAALGAEIVAL